MTSRAAIALMILVFFAALFLVLRSNQFTAVDGALRCLDVYHHPHLSFHGNNHLLYPVNILVWSKLAGVGGLSPETPGEYMRLSQSMNCLSAAATLAFLWLLISGILVDRLLSLLLVIVYGFSRAFLLHATNSAEPVVGLMWSIASLFFLREGLMHRKLILVSLSGFLLALAFASYQAMVASVLLSLWLCAFSNGKGESHGSAMRDRSKALVVFCFSSLLGVFLIFGWAYSFEGVHFGLDMVRRFVRIEGGNQGYGGVTVSKLLNFPIGFLNNLVAVVPDTYSGLRSLLTPPDFVSYSRILAMGCLASVLLVLLAKPVRREYSASSDAGKVRFLLGTVAVSALLLPLVYWDPLYDKLWLLPLAILSVCLAYAAKLSVHDKRILRTVISLLAIFAAIEISMNVHRAIIDHNSETRGLKEAMKVMSVVKPNDSIVLDFDQVSAIYEAYSGNGNAVMLPSLLRADAERALSMQLIRCRTTQGKLYFLGILDQTVVAWKLFLESRMGIPYTSFDQYRLHSRTVERFQVSGHPLTLRVYEP